LRFADFLRDQAGHAVDGESLFMTNGSSQGLQMVLDLFTSEGDTIFVENPTYFLALAIFKVTPTSLRAVVVACVLTRLLRRVEA
jgi:DNA-binding transcriptional MocR family regulator